MDLENGLQVFFLFLVYGIETDNLYFGRNITVKILSAFRLLFENRTDRIIRFKLPSLTRIFESSNCRNDSRITAL